jgi:hypothetical protein
VHVAEISTEGGDRKTRRDMALDYHAAGVIDNSEAVGPNPFEEGKQPSRSRCERCRRRLDEDADSSALCQADTVREEVGETPQLIGDLSAQVGR